MERPEESNPAFEVDMATSMTIDSGACPGPSSSDGDLDMKDVEIETKGQTKIGQAIASGVSMATSTLAFDGDLDMKDVEIETKVETKTGSSKKKMGSLEESTIVSGESSAVSMIFDPDQPAASYILHSQYTGSRMVWIEYFGLQEFKSSCFSGGVEALEREENRPWREAYAKVVGRETMIAHITTMKQIIELIKMKTKEVYGVNVDEIQHDSPASKYVDDIIEQFDSKTTCAIHKRIFNE